MQAIFLFLGRQGRQLGITKHWSCLRCPDDEQGVGKNAKSLTIGLTGKSDSDDEVYQRSL
jgi:hypothetical protein